MIPALNNGFRQLLSSYAQAINKQQGRSGSLFRQKTRTKSLEDCDEHYPLICFHYIHQNPLRAGFVSKLEDREFSSFTDYLGMRNGSLGAQQAAIELLGISKDLFYQDSYRVIPPDMSEKLF